MTSPSEMIMTRPTAGIHRSSVTCILLTAYSISADSTALLEAKQNPTSVRASIINMNHLYLDPGLVRTIYRTPCTLFSRHLINASCYIRSATTVVNVRQSSPWGPGSVRLSQVQLGLPQGNQPDPQDLLGPPPWPAAIRCNPWPAATSNMHVHVMATIIITVIWRFGTVNQSTAN